MMRDHAAVEGKVRVLDGVGGHHRTVHLHHGLHGGHLGLVHALHALHHGRHVHGRHLGRLDGVPASLRQDRQVGHLARLSGGVILVPPRSAFLGEGRRGGEKGRNGKGEFDSRHESSPEGYECCEAPGPPHSGGGAMETPCAPGAGETPASTRPALPFGERQSGPAAPRRAPHPFGIAPRQQGDRHDRSGRSAPVPVRQGVLARQQRRQARLSAAGGRVVPGCIMRMDQGWRMCRASCRFSLRITRNQRCAHMGEGMIVIMGHNALRGGGMGDKHRNRQDRDRTRQHLPDGRSPRADRCRLHGSCNADRRDLFQITAWPLSRKNG